MELAGPCANDHGNILVISGWRGVGKTALCQKVAARAQRLGRRVAGLLSPGRFVEGKKTGIFAATLATGETRLLASAIPGEVTGIQLGPWAFDSSVVEWGNQCLERSAGAELAIIDELGPLEFERKTGWSAGFAVLRRKAYRLALVVIRPELVGAFSAQGFVFCKKEVTPETDPDVLATDILNLWNG